MAELMTGTAAPLGVKALVRGDRSRAAAVPARVEARRASRSDVAGLYLAIVVWNTSLLALLATGVA